MPLLNPGRLRHRVAIQERVETQDPNSGDITYTWQNVRLGFADEWSSIPAAIEPLSAREFVAAQATQSKVVGRVMVRARPGLLAKQRVVHRNTRTNVTTIYNIEGVLTDPDSGLEYVTLPVSTGPNEG